MRKSEIFKINFAKNRQKKTKKEKNKQNIYAFSLLNAKKNDILLECVALYKGVTYRKKTLPGIAVGGLFADNLVGL